MGIPRRVGEGVFYLGKDMGKGGDNVYFYTKSKMGTHGERKGHVNFLGEIRAGNVGNPNCIMAVDYALSKDSYLPASVKAAIRKVVKIVRK